MIRNTLLVLLAFGLLGGGYFLYQYQSPVPPVPNFSSFATVDESLFSLTAKPAFAPELVTELSFRFDTFPHKLIDEEIESLVRISERRAEELVKQHQREYENIFDITIGNGNTLGDYIENNPLTRELYNIMVNDIEIIVANKKLQFDVARPNQIDLRVNPVVKTPATPSYPSMFAAKAAIAHEVLELFLKPEEQAVVFQGIKDAIFRKQIVGLSTYLDTEYGTQLAVDYAKVLLNDKSTQEFLELIREREWSGKPTWEPNNVTPFSNIRLGNQGIEQTGKTILFKTEIENTGLGDTLETFMVTLELDRFGDGTVDKEIDIPIAKIAVKDIRTIGYTLEMNWLGTNLFRFVVNKNLDFQEEYHHDNFGRWVEFEVDG